jgi:hypothetical protein
MDKRRVAILLIGLLMVGSVSGRGPWRASEENVRGWQLMTAEERIEHQARIRSFTTLEACRSYQESHHRSMDERARQRGLPDPSGGRDICAHLKPDQPSP